MLGAFAVGKTSLVRRFVSSVFEDKYLTTVGVKIDKKQLVVDSTDVTLMLWDLAGQDEFQTVQMSYLRGASGFFVIADGTRRATLDVAMELRGRALEATKSAAAPIPHMLLVNKADLAESWEITDADLAPFAAESVAVIKASAKTGDAVEAAFSTLARAML